MRASPRRRSRLAAGALVAASAATALLSAGGEPARPHGAAARVSSAPAPASSVTAAAAFAILRRHRTPSDAIPRDTRVQLARGRSIAEAAADLGRARRAAVAHGSTWVARGSRGVCLVVDQTWVPTGALTLPASAAGCATLANAMRGELVLSVLDAVRRHEYLAGLAPDGVRSVRLLRADAPALALAVRDDVYTADLYGSQATAAQLRFAHGRVRTLSLAQPPTG